MGKRGSSDVFAALVLCTACGSGGGGTGDSGNGGTGDSLTGSLRVTAHHPADGGVQVALTDTVRVTFEAAVALDCLQDDETSLRAGGTVVTGTFTLADASKTVVFTPAAPLERETDYTFQLSPLTCDTTGRILEDHLRFSFRTLDDRPPSITSASVRDGQTGVDRLAPLVVHFDEAIAPSSASSVQLLDAFGRSYTIDATVEAATLTIAPAANLAGNRKYILVVGGGTNGVKDRAGNPLPQSWSVGFWTAADATPPFATAVWPGSQTGISPRVAPTITFDESIDPYSIEPSSVIFTDTFLNQVPFSVQPSRDQKTLRLVPRAPLTPGVTYAIGLSSGLAGVTDLTGNGLAAQHISGFTIGVDAQAPTLVTAFPADGESRVSLNVRPELRFDEALEPASISPATARLEGPAGPIAATVTVAGSSITWTPLATLVPGAALTIVVKGGFDGVRDLAGNALTADVRVGWRTSDDGTLPSVLLAPEDGSSSVPVGVRISCIFDQPMDPATIHNGTVQVSRDAHGPVAGTTTLERNGRVLRFVPTSGWTSGSWYTLRITGGPLGVREATGNWLDRDATSRFRVGFTTDQQAPAITATLNRTDGLRNQNMTVPPFGFTVNVDTHDPVHYSIDLASIEVSINGDGGPVPGGDTIFEHAAIRWNGLDYLLPRQQALRPGNYALVATVRDLSGNVTASNKLNFRVASAADDVLPFERTQVVWVRFDLDRDGNGRADFEDDLLALGLIAAGDPIGSNARMTQIARDGILAATNLLYGRAANGSPLGADSVPLRLTHRNPRSLPHMQIGCGGLDPEGSAGRTYGAESTGTLGRAFFDYRNSATNELNIQSNPGLGVFPSELFLFQASIHLQVYPSFITTFARRFLKLSPHMGGTPAGSGPLDATVLAPGFDYDAAAPAERARFDAVFGATDDWVTAIGIILAHEIGHSLGLVAVGPLSRGLHGDNSLHNEFSSVTDVMAAAVGYDAMVSLQYAFRDLNIAYLRQRLLLK